MNLDPKVISLIAAGLSRNVGKDNAVTAKHIIEKMKAIGCDINKTSLWEIVRHLRMERGMFICADSSGYYLPANEAEREHQIASLNSRMREIEETRDALLRIKSGINQLKMEL